VLMYQEGLKGKYLIGILHPKPRRKRYPTKAIN